MRLTANEMRFVHQTAARVWYKRNDEILQELHMKPNMNCIKKYQLNLLGPVKRMNDYRILKALLYYHSV